MIWQKSSFSGGTTANECVEIASDGEAVKIRESDEPGVTLTTTPGSLKALIFGIKEGEFHQLG